MTRQSSLDILAALVGFDTTSHKSNLPCIDWIEAYLARHGVAGERFPDATGQKASLFATIGPREREGWILSGHTDVVPVTGQSWTSDPFTLRVADGRAYGRGTTDMKGFLACCLAAVPQMVAARLTAPIHLAFSYDEEIGCVGVVPMIEALAARGFRAQGCFVGEPTLNEVIIGHKGKQALRATVRGFSCHSSRAPDGVNAVEYAARLIAFIHGVGARLAREGARDEAYDIPYSTFQSAVIRGGEAVNIIPNVCTFDFETRVIAADDREAIVGEARRYAAEVLEPEMRRVAPETGIEFAIISDASTLETSPEAPVAAMAKRLAGRNAHAKVAFGTEACHFAAIGGVDSVVVGPGSIDQAHKPDEFIALAELARCDAFV
ncbi:MAG: acetylornithine deacetylase, partial [Methylobacteriaceae bacterium]|nr:acetylornithine deacetylase [Methylobacteriaceae bacterium]